MIWYLKRVALFWRLQHITALRNRYISKYMFWTNVFTFSYQMLNFKQLQENRISYAWHDRFGLEWQEHVNKNKLTVKRVKWHTHKKVEKIRGRKPPEEVELLKEKTVNAMTSEIILGTLFEKFLHFFTETTPDFPPWFRCFVLTSKVF